MTFERTRDNLVDDFSAVLAEAEDLLKKASNETGDRARDLRIRPRLAVREPPQLAPHALLERSA